MLRIIYIMGKIILEFDSVEESQDARTALDGWKWKLAMWDLDQELRKTSKYAQSIIEQGEASDVEIDIAHKLRDTVREILNDYNLSLED